MIQSPISTSIAGQVSAGVRKRGAQYFARGDVKVVLADRSSVHAIVHGSREYSVYLELKGDELQVQCDCPYFDGEFDTCKHIWATFLAAQAKGCLRIMSS